MPEYRFRTRPGSPDGVSPPTSPVQPVADLRNIPPAPPSEKPPTPKRHGQARLVVGVLAIIAVAVTAWWFLVHLPASQPTSALVASGIAEADEALISPEVSGRLVAVSVVEGQTVQAGDLLASLDDSLVQLQLRQSDPATVEQLKLQLTKYRLVAPTSGVVTHVAMKVGEVALPGETVVAVADLARLKVTVYVPESDLGKVHAPQPVQVTADPFPSRVFDGVVTSINQQAEFTPRNVQTRNDRLNLMFGVNLLVDNPDDALKPGMPVDVTFPESS